MTCGDYPPGVTGNERAIRGWEPHEITCENGFSFEEWCSDLEQEWFAEDELRSFWKSDLPPPVVDDMAEEEIEREKFHSEIYEL